MSHGLHHKIQNEEKSDDRMADLDQDENDSPGKREVTMNRLITIYLCFLFYLLNNENI